MRRRSVLACAGVLLLLAADPANTVNKSAARGAEAGPPSAENADQQLKDSLLVQAAMQQARECLARDEWQIAVRVLERHLPKINGNAAYLALLEEAYRGLIRDLKKKGLEEQAQRYVDRLAILDPGINLSAAVRPLPQERRSQAALEHSPGKVEPPNVVVRGQSADDKKPAASEVRSAEAAVAAGHQEFDAHHYREAAAHYQKAAQLDRNLAAGCRERWAYCKLFVVTEQVNNPPPDGPDWAALEQEVRVALTLAPRMEYGHTLLRVISERSQAAPAKPSSPVEHRSQRVGDWQVMESANFRVHYYDAALADQVLQIAEHTRRAVALKWLGQGTFVPWSPKCDVYLHPSVQEYSRATGVGADSPGHSSIGADPQDAAHIVSRVIHLHADDPHMLPCILPHETTHVTLAGQYGPKPLPRWADEGLAILSEPADRVQRHLDAAPEAAREGHSFTSRQLLLLDEYPEPGRVAAFYGESVAVVSYLTDLRGPQAFTAFLRSAQREGYEAALKRHYSLDGFADLDKHWRQQPLKVEQLTAQK